MAQGTNKLIVDFLSNRPVESIATPRRERVPQWNGRMLTIITQAGGLGPDIPAAFPRHARAESRVAVRPRQRRADSNKILEPKRCIIQ